MAELADALDSGSSGLTALEVRVLFRAPPRTSFRQRSRFLAAIRQHVVEHCGLQIAMMAVREDSANH
jgi:hypothetical protein